MGSFPDDVVRKAWLRAGTRCECKRTTHKWHVGRCVQNLSWRDGGKETIVGWEAHHKVSQDKGGEDSLENCEILCMACYKAVTSPG